MIAEPNRHPEPDMMRQLLDDKLSREQAVQVESHLDSCQLCRHELEQLAGPQQWWEETVHVLSQSTLPAPRRAQRSAAEQASGSGSQTRSLDSSLQWIRPLLDESEDGELGRIDHYPVDGVIGQGGMGVVLRGLDPELNRPVAIKILSPHLAGVGAARARFMREAQAAAAIVHPSIVPIYSIATAARLPYIVMPCISGGNLQERLDQQGPMELCEVLRIGLQIAEGLEAAHRQGVIHRDIKPANILVEEGNGRVLISDFGLARALDDATLTMSGMIAGTPQFMSPEQARGEVVDERTDLFSLGSLLYALSIGRPPFRAETPLAVLRKISDSRPKPVTQINEQMPAWIDRIIGKLMTIDKTARISSAGEAADLLREALAHARNPTAQPLPKPIRGNRSTVGPWLAGILSPLVLGLGTWFAFGPPADGNRSAGSPSTVRVGQTETGTADPTPPRDWSGQEVDAELAAINLQITSLVNGLNAANEGSTVTTVTALQDGDATAGGTVRSSRGPDELPSKANSYPENEVKP
jgi:serine/threonine-protein kinase